MCMTISITRPEEYESEIQRVSLVLGLDSVGMLTTGFTRNTAAADAAFT
jgi:hypothetical protein